MNIKKILVISLALIMVTSSLSVASAGLFGFGEDDNAVEKQDIRLGNITDSDISAISMSVEGGIAKVTNDGIDTSSADVGYNVEYSVQVDISDLNDTSRKLLEEAIEEEETILDITFINLENDNHTSFYGASSDVNYTIEDNILYIEGKSSNNHNPTIQDTLDGEVKANDVEIQKWNHDDNSPDGHLEAIFSARYNDAEE